MPADPTADPPAPICPSAQPEMPGAQVLAVIVPGAGERRLSYVAGHMPVDAALLDRVAPLPPTEVLRFAAPCQSGRCVHFAEGACRLATRVATMLDPAADRAPPCAIRRACRWHAQEGVAACLRCPRITTTVTAERDGHLAEVALG